MIPKRHADGQYPAYAWPGGYPLVYYTNQCECVCAKCASRDVDESREVVACDIYWEGEDIACEDCGKPIQSAYGIPE